MFYDVRVSNGKGKLKKVVSGKELSKKHWQDFADKTVIGAPVKGGKKRGRKGKPKVDIEVNPLFLSSKN